jgi:hypothetical protein
MDRTGITSRLSKTGRRCPATDWKPRIGSGDDDVGQYAADVYGTVARVEVEEATVRFIDVVPTWLKLIT